MNINVDELLLRRPEPNDIEQLYRFRNDWDIIRCLGGFSKGYSRKDLHDWLEFHRAKEDEIIWVIAESKSDKCIGHAGLYKIDYRVRCAEFAILIGDQSWWGKGYGKRISLFIIEYGFSQLNLHRLKLYALASNKKAISLYRNIGFKEEGVLRDEQFRSNKYLDVIVMGLLKNEWKVKQ